MKIITFNKNGTFIALKAHFACTHITVYSIYLGQFHALIQFSNAEYASDAKMVRLLTVLTLSLGVGGAFFKSTLNINSSINTDISNKDRLYICVALSVISIKRKLSILFASVHYLFNMQYYSSLYSIC